MLGILKRRLFVPICAILVSPIAGVFVTFFIIAAAFNCVFTGREFAEITRNPFGKAEPENTAWGDVYVSDSEILAATATLRNFYADSPEVPPIKYLAIKAAILAARNERLKKLN